MNVNDNEKTKLMSKMKRILLGIVTAFLSIGLVFYFFTMESFQELEMLRMRSSGISSQQTPEFHYFEKNNCEMGKPCQCALLIHGLGDFALTWRKIMSLDQSSFVQKLHFFAPNLPGALSTPKLKTQSDYNVQNTARLIAEAFIPKCESWIIVGNSYGGWLATFMALNLPQVKGLLLLGSAGLNKDYSHVTNYYMNPTIDGAKDFYHRVYAKPKNVPDLIFKRVVERVKDQPVLEQLRSITNADYVDGYLGQLKIPVYYLWGDKDRVIFTEWAETYKQLTPGSELKIVKDCGHVPQKECTEEVMKSLNELLARVNESDLRKAH